MALSLLTALHVLRSSKILSVSELHYWVKCANNSTAVNVNQWSTADCLLMVLSKPLVEVALLYSKTFGTDITLFETQVLLKCFK